MAGTIFGLGLSQRVDPNGAPDSGWKLYLYAAASSTPVTAYKDTGLTAGQEHPWPIAADAYGMMPSFWLADGSYRARGTSADGSRTFFDLSSVLALGASSGGGGGSSVDPTTIFQTGDHLWVPIAGTRSGWVRSNGRTIGSATSGATERANSDCQALFEFLWNNYTNAIWQCPVSGGRGASAAADWSANKKIQLLDFRGFVPGGLDDMGNSAAGRLANVPVAAGTVTTAVAQIGESTHTLLRSEIPTGLIDITLNDPGHQHPFDLAATSGAGFAQGGAGGLTAFHTDPATTGITVNVIDNAGGLLHNNVQKTILGTFYMKL